MRFVPFAEHSLFFLSVNAGFQTYIRVSCLLPDQGISDCVGQRAMMETSLNSFITLDEHESFQMRCGFFG